MALERTNLGALAPATLRYNRSTESTNTAGSLAGLANLAKGAYQEYKNVQKTDDARQAQADIINQTISPNLDKESGIYHELVVKAELNTKFNDYKDGIKSGKYNNTEPEEFQKTLKAGYAEERKQIAEETKYPGIYSGIQSKFWLEKEGVLIAAQRASYGEELKKNQGIIYAKTLGESLSPELPEEKLKETFKAVFDTSGGSLDLKTRLSTAMSIAANHAMQGSDALLNVLQEEYSVQNIPGLRHIYNAARKTYTQATIAKDRSYVINERDRYTELAEQGVFGKQHVEAMLQDPKLKGSVTNSFMGELLKRSRRQNITMRSKDAAYIRMQNGEDIGTLSTTDFNEVFNGLYKEIRKGTKDEEAIGNEVGRILTRQTKVPTAMKSLATSAFTRTRAVLEDGSINPEMLSAYTLFRGIEKNKGMGKGQFHKLFDPDSLRTYTILNSYMGTQPGSIEERFSFAAQKLQDIQDFSGQIDQDTVRLNYETINDQVDAYITEVDDTWFGVADEYKRNTYRSRLMNVAKAEIRRGVPTDAAIEYAKSLVNSSYEVFAGQPQYTGGVSIDVQAGFTQQGTAQEAWGWATRFDPELKKALSTVYGEDYDVSELRAVLTPDTNALVIGGDTEQAITIGLSTLGQKYRNHLASLNQGTTGKDVSTLDQGTMNKEISYKAYDSVLLDDFFNKLINNKSESVRGSKETAILGLIDVDKVLEDTTPDKPAEVKEEVVAFVKTINDQLSTMEQGDKPESETKDMTDTIRVKINKGVGAKNNNPGNLRFAKQTGATKGKGGFAKFKTPEEGFRALERQIDLDKSRDHTVGTFINKYAPPVENDTGNYINYVIKGLGITKSTKLKDVDTFELAKRMAKLESGTEVTSINELQPMPDMKPAIDIRPSNTDGSFMQGFWLDLKRFAKYFLKQ